MKAGERVAKAMLRDCFGSGSVLRDTLRFFCPGNAAMLSSTAGFGQKRKLILSNLWPKRWRDIETIRTSVAKAAILRAN